MWIDSHCHFQFCLQNNPTITLQSLIDDAIANQVNQMLCVATTLEDNIYPYYQAYPDHVRISVGLHPNEVVVKEPTVKQLVQQASRPGIVAIGETGLDCHHMDVPMNRQVDRFRKHLEAACTLNLPVIVHTRQAPQETLKVIQEFPESKGVLHSFTETFSMASEAIALGYLISFSGIVTFKNAKDLQQVALQLPLAKILIETDSPYLSPHPFRGKSNNPSRVKWVGQTIAQLHNQPEEVVAKRIQQNFHELFTWQIS